MEIQILTFHCKKKKTTIKMKKIDFLVKPQERNTNRKKTLIKSGFFQIALRINWVVHDEVH